MGLLIAWLLISTVVGLIGLLRPEVPIVVALLILGFVPASASGMFTGVPYAESSGLPSLHPGSWIILIAALVALLAGPAGFLGGLLGESPSTFILWLLACSIAIATTLLSRGTQGTSQFLETIVTPGAMALLVIRQLRRDPGFRGSLLGGLQVYGLIVGVLAIAEGVLRTDLVWANDYGLQSWHVSYGLDGFRATVFGDHPLNTALVLLGCLPLMNVRTLRGFRPGLLGGLVCTAGIAATGSRSAVAFAIVYLFVLGLRRPRTAVPALVSLLVVAWVIDVTDFGQRLLGRFFLDSNSSYVRFGALSELAHNWGHYLITGNGVGFSGQVSTALLGQSVSFENGPLMMALDIGVVGAAAFVMAMVFLALRGGPHRMTSVTVAFGLSLLMSAAYSSFGTKSPMASFIWLLALLAPSSIHAATRGPVRQAPTEVAIESDRVEPERTVILR